MSEEKKSIINRMKMMALSCTALTAALSSCTEMSYQNATGYWETSRVSGVSADQFITGIGVVGSLVNDNRAIRNYSRSCSGPQARPISGGCRPSVRPPCGNGGGTFYYTDAYGKVLRGPTAAYRSCR
ncbi:MAG: hypothetical protein ACI4QM_01040 [Alphaproteobacteria bacterium]